MPDVVSAALKRCAKKHALAINGPCKADLIVLRTDRTLATSGSRKNPTAPGVLRFETGRVLSLPARAAMMRTVALT
jgi:hypothetical protein